MDRSEKEYDRLVHFSILSSKYSMTWREVVIYLSKIGLSIVCVPLLIPKDPGDRVHIVAESLLPMMFLGLRKLGNICCEHILSVPDTKFVTATNVARGQTGKHLCRQQCVRNNVSSFARALNVPLCYASAAYQASLVEPWFVFGRDAVEPKYP